jgi:hypothetical protein
MSDEKSDMLSKPKILQIMCHYSIQIKHNHDALSSKFILRAYLRSEIKSAEIKIEHMRHVKRSFWTDYMKHNKYEIHFTKH